MPRPIPPFLAVVAAGLLTACGESLGPEAASEAREEAQHMALYLSGELTPPTWLSHRVRVSLHAIREKYGDEYEMLREVRFKLQWVPSRLLVAVTAEAHAMILSGDYDEWDHLNEELGMIAWETADLPGLFVLNFEGVKHAERLVEAYQGLPGVWQATPEVSEIAWPNVFPLLVSGQLRFLFWDPWCPPPARICRTNDYVYLVQDDEGLVLRGAWQRETDPFEPRWWPEASVNIERYFNGEG